VLVVPGFPGMVNVLALPFTRVLNIRGDGLPDVCHGGAFEKEMYSCFSILLAEDAPRWTVYSSSHEVVTRGNDTLKDAPKE